MLENLEGKFKDGKMHFYMWNDISLELVDFVFVESFGFAENIHEAKIKTKEHLKELEDEVESKPNKEREND